MNELPAGYSIETSGSGMNLVLRKYGVWITYAPKYGQGRAMLIAIAWAMESVGQPLEAQ